MCIYYLRGKISDKGAITLYEIKTPLLTSYCYTVAPVNSKNNI